MCPAFYGPAGSMEQIRSCLPDVTTSGDQDLRHDCRFSRCRGRDFNFFKNVFLNSANLFETNQFQKREKSHNDFDSRDDSPEQIGKTDGRTGCDALQDRVDLLRDAETFAENLLLVLSRFHLFGHVPECVDQLKNSNVTRSVWFCTR